MHETSGESYVMCKQFQTKQPKQSNRIASLKFEAPTTDSTGKLKIKSYLNAFIERVFEQVRAAAAISPKSNKQQNLNMF